MTFEASRCQNVSQGVKTVTFAGARGTFPRLYSQAVSATAAIRRDSEEAGFIKFRRLEKAQFCLVGKCGGRQRGLAARARARGETL